jgi:uncharacterized membrane protein
MDHDFNEQEPAGSPGGPPGAFPPGAYPPGAYPPGAYPPGAYPPGAYPPGYPPQVIIEKKSNTGLILGIIAIVLLVLCALPTLAILAVTFLGRQASSKFSSVGSTIDDVRLTVVCLPALFRFRRYG